MPRMALSLLLAALTVLTSLTAQAQVQSAPDWPFKLHIDSELMHSHQAGNSLYLLTRSPPILHFEQYGSVSTQAFSSFAHDQCWLSADSGHYIYMTVFDIQHPDHVQQFCASTPISAVYQAQRALYLIDAGYAQPPKQRLITRLHRFELHGIDQTQAVSYSGSYQVPGHLGWGDDISRLREYQDVLTLLTTQWHTGQPVHRLFQIAVPTVDAPLFRLLDQLPNTAYPMPLGQSNRAINQIRFTVHRAYLAPPGRDTPVSVVDISVPGQLRPMGEE